jgi:recombination protein RecR
MLKIVWKALVIPCIFYLISMTMNLPSKYLQDAVDQMAALPGIGKRTALRLVLHLIAQSDEDVNGFAASFSRLKSHVKQCRNCGNLSDVETCQICTDVKRDQTLICVVQDIRDILAIENTMQYRGLYHVLGGLISPMDGVGPGDLSIEQLIERAQQGGVKEVILALSATMEGDTTNYYLFKRLQHCQVEVSVIARGIGIGSEIEYTDEVTLGRSITSRSLFELALSK